MKLKRIHFDVLEMFATERENLHRHTLENETRYSHDEIEQTVIELSDLGYIESETITKIGLNALEPYRVKRAIFIAAGFGSRLVPITFNTPKPLVRVHGARIIDHLIDACLATEINEIYIVRGYLAEQFDQLLYKYPMVKFLENPVFNETNNISSSLVAKSLLSNAYIFEADLLLSNPNIIKKYQYASNFLGIKHQRSDDWCFRVKDGIIVDQEVGGEGDDIWQMVGISYWNEEDGRKLSEDIARVYQSPGGKERYWEQVPLRYCKDHYRVEIRDCLDSDIVEIDTFKELKEIDAAYDI